LRKNKVASGVTESKVKAVKDNYIFLKKFLYSDMKSCSEIQTEFIHELFFENKNPTPSSDQMNILVDMVDYIWQRGRIISVLVESHSSSFEDLLHNNKMSIQRGKFIKDILSNRIKDSIIKLIPYGDAINLTAKSKYIDSNINNRVSVSVIRCLDKYKPLF
jgi:outer membrane protein OmpA-like peptidoglycan-associated protein